MQTQKAELKALNKQKLLNNTAFYPAIGRGFAEKQ